MLRHTHQRRLLAVAPTAAALALVLIGFGGAHTLITVSERERSTAHS